MKKVILTTIAIAGFLSTRSETAGRNIEPGKKLNVQTGDTGGIKLPPDGKKHDLAFDTGGVLPHGSGKKFDYAPCGDLWYHKNTGSLR